MQQYPVGDFCFWVCLALCPQCQPIANFCGSGIISVSISQHAWLDAQTAAVCGELLWLRHNLCGLPSTFVVWAVFPGPVSNFCGNSPTPCGFPNDPPQCPEVNSLSQYQRSYMDLDFIELNQNMCKCAKLSIWTLDMNTVEWTGLSKPEIEIWMLRIGSENDGEGNVWCWQRREKLFPIIM